MENIPLCYQQFEMFKNTCKGNNSPQCKTCKYYIWFKLGDEDTFINVVKTLLES